MNVQVTRRGADMEFLSVPFKVSRIALGTWAIGGWMWGGTNEDESIRTICAALDCGINLIDTAPVYGFGRSEEIIGRALAQGGRRKQALIATKTGLDWKDNKPFRNASRLRICNWRKQLQSRPDECLSCDRAVKYCAASVQSVRAHNRDVSTFILSRC
jgi:aryl-alcohol dehydrogenase-like predicted oxidoreductase